MRNGVLLSVLVVGFIALTAVTVDTVLLQPDSAAPSSIAPFDPEDELNLSPIGRELISIHRLAKTDSVQALELLSSLQEQFDQTFTPTQKAYWLLTRMNIAYRQQELALIPSLTTRLTDLEQANNLDWLKAQLLSSEAVRQVQHGELEDASELIERAIKAAEDINALFLLPKAYNAAGYVSNSMNQLIEAQHYFTRGLRVARELGDEQYISTILNNLALLYLHIEKWDKALEYLKQAHDLAVKNGVDQPETLQIIMLNTSYVYKKLGNVEQALRAYKESLQYYDENNADVRQKMIKLKGDAEISLLVDDFATAKTAAFECINFPIAPSYPLEYGQCHLLKSRALFETGEYERALVTINAAIVTFQSIDHDRWLIRAYEHKSKVFERLDEPQFALEMYRTFHHEDKQQLLTKVYDLERAFATEQVQQEKELLDVEKKLTELQLSKEKLRLQLAYVWIGLVAAALVLVLRKAFSVETKNKELETLSNVDQLTKLNNRRFYHNQLASNEVLDAEALYRVVLLDLDHFKQVNDKHGHDVGDEVLIETAKRLKNLAAESELLIRWGGEEFLLLIKDDAIVEQRVHQVLEIINQSPYVTAVGELDITTSIGVSLPASSAELSSDDGYFRKADQNLYEAKRSGRNRAVFPL